jgi:hypothetical protein
MTAPDDVSSTSSMPKSRRAVLAGALGGLGAWAASAVGGASPVRAEGENIVVGGEYSSAESVTRLRNHANDATVFRAESAISGIGVWGLSNSYTGVIGTNFATDQPAIAGEALTNSTGVLGYSGEATRPAARAKTGVYGHATQDSGSRGVWGRSNAGEGVRGQATSGIGGFFTATTGVALQTTGRTKFSTSGVAAIPAGSTSLVLEAIVNVTSGTFVLLTPKVDIGARRLWFTTNTADNTFTIRMSSARSSVTRVAWLLLG